MPFSTPRALEPQQPWNIPQTPTPSVILSENPNAFGLKESNRSNFFDQLAIGHAQPRH
jgi:hypothetical protein